MDCSQRQQNPFLRLMDKPFKLPPVMIELKPSKVVPGEVGVFAARRLSKGSVIPLPEGVRLATKFVEWRVLQCDRPTLRKIKRLCLTSSSGFFYGGDLNFWPAAWYVNHSCDPNLGFDSQRNFVVLEPVRKGEELTIDYAFGERDPQFRMVCKCGTPDCRGIVTGDDWRNPTFRTKYQQYFWPHREKIE
jgi:hypothetical protein